MKSTIIDSDLSMPLHEWQNLIDRLMTEYGPSIQLSTGQACGKSHLELLVPTPPERKPDGEFTNWEHFNLMDKSEEIARAVRFDTEDNHCPTLQHLVRARNQGTFPVRYWIGGE